ncbi:eukaryotic translation initiation factor SUI1 family protein [Rhizoctonia solani AG-1 IA]|uniref:Eukaryotic translation initiation factor SUI1 family protein n=1 Tax=Thanatephorus cucumeris (strain AG1-IA) TaxID=983506 RepID=L8WWG5_THACA|nr:eukaryotic translation initiation factor SUI1 family protein [Rhizoctonia solani AG-1 IA]
MFKKPPHKIFTSSPLRNSDVKVLRQRVLVLFPDVKDKIDVDALVPKGISSCKFDTHLDETGVSRNAGKGGIVQSNLVPTVYTLWKCPTLLPTISTPAAVIPILVGGADLMIPGVVPSPIIPSLAQGQLVSITQYRSTTPLVVGSMAINGSELRDDDDQKGKAVITLHATGDALWALGSKQEPPEGNQPEAAAPTTDSVDGMTKAVEDVKLDGEIEQDGASTQAVTSERVPSAQDSAEIEILLRSTTLYALARVDASALPLPASTFYSSHILPSRPARPILPQSNETDEPIDPKTFISHLDIKHTSHKKLAPFLKGFEKDGILKLKDVRGELLIFSVDTKHPALVEAIKWGWKTVGAEERKEKEREKESTTGGSTKEILVEEVWFSEHPTNPKFVVLDEVLSHALLRKGENDKEFVGRDELVDRLSGNMKGMWRVGGTVITLEYRKLPLHPVNVQTKTRQGRKVVTLITGFEPFGIDPETLSEELRKRCASSTSVSPCVEKPKQLEVMVQGSQIKAVTTLLLELGLPRKWIKVSESSVKGKGVTRTSRCNHHGGRRQSWFLEAGAYFLNISWRFICNIYNSSHDPGLPASVCPIPSATLWRGINCLCCSALYMHALKFPRNADYDTPELYGLARMIFHKSSLPLSLTLMPAGKTLNLNLTTADDVRLGAWFVAADSFYQKHLRLAPPFKGDSANLKEKSRETLASLLPTALQNHPTILFFHGNAMTRAFHLRTRLYSTLSSRLNANVLAIDYRGFGNSEGVPSEQGLLLDARAAWDWLIENGAKEADITVVGQSLGTGVSAGLVAELAEEGRGMVLLAPYSSIATLLETYDLGGKLPILQPLQKFRFVFGEAVCDDWDIPVAHAKVLFDALLESLLPPHPFNPQDVLLGKVPHEEFSTFISERNTRRNQVVATMEIKGLGTISTFSRDDSHGDVTFLQTTWGEHNGISAIEGVIDVIGWSVGMADR